MRAPLIPNVIGRPVDSAVTLLAFTKLQVVQIESVTTRMPRGAVVAQRPPVPERVIP